MPIKREILKQVIESSSEPLVIVRVDHPDWPVELSNPAFESIGGEDTRGKPFADVIEQLVGREFALEISETVRSQQETSFPVELSGKEYLLALKPLPLPGESDARFYVAFWRGAGGGGGVAGSEMHHELLNAKRRIRDLSRNDPVTGLLNGHAFREVLAHDWAVAAREKSTLSLVVFTLDDFDAYVDVFGRHAADSCLRRVGQAIRRCLRRASDVVGRLDRAEFIVLSHASDADGVHEFAKRISAAVRDLGLHHPRSTVSKFVTVSFRVGVGSAADKKRSAKEFIDALLSGVAE
ncbi:MAG: GGDEF domain-containing protein [Gammaproteobacteria bacterium]|nr:GGDEF domain-containing protein [Gammaproteobacteria bacterium]MDH3373578.1 GGDEF domain-containing protein [Gammaproteobacteria bacterium]MDH3408644.1 GGDEF domain-containing protein [Gammaproteobacteria bacterium]